MKPPISLHAVTGVHTGNTMLVRLRLGDFNVHTLINSGSTHNLVAKEVASRTGLPMGECVTVANGECAPCIGPILWDFMAFTMLAYTILKY
jgi:hypothetical protein